MPVDSDVRLTTGEPEGVSSDLGIPAIGLILRLGLGQTDDTLTGLELPALLQKLDALEALQHAALGRDRAGSFKAGMLTHGAWIMVVCKRKSKVENGKEGLKALKRLKNLDVKAERRRLIRRPTASCEHKRSGGMRSNPMVDFSPFDASTFSLF
jgi:hypothetical protein